MSVKTPDDHSTIRQTKTSQVIFRIAPGSQGRHGEPMRRVAGIFKNEDAWQGMGVLDEQQLEDLPVSLPEDLSDRIITFARKHIGPGATDPEVKYFCHTYAGRCRHYCGREYDTGPRRRAAVLYVL